MAYFFIKIDVEIITDEEALVKENIDIHTGDFIVIGTNNKFGGHILRSGPGIVTVSPQEFTVHGETFAGSSLGARAFKSDLRLIIYSQHLYFFILIHLRLTDRYYFSAQMITMG